MSWTEERVEMLKRLVAEGLPCSQIAGELGGLTRNAVIGKIHRLGLVSLNKPSVPARPRTPRKHRARTYGFSLKRVAEARKARPALEAAWKPSGEPVAFFDLMAHHCRWPMSGEGRNMQFCGNSALLPLPYCPRHCRASYTQPARRR